MTYARPVKTIPKSIDGVKLPSKQADRKKVKNSFLFRFRISRRSFYAAIFVLSVLVIVSVVLVTMKLYHDTHLSEVNKVESAVGKLYVLPKDEQPALATVTNRKKLVTPFMRQADNGDKVLIYLKAKIVIIYRPSINKIIAVGPVDITPPDQSTANNQGPGM